MASPTSVALAANPSESASLHGHKAKTPIIAGAVSGACVGLAWIIGFIVYFYKRQRRQRRAKAAGLKSHRDLEEPVEAQSKYIIPPDPALVHNVRPPGPKKQDRDPFTASADCTGAESVDSHTREAGPSGDASSASKASDGVSGEPSISLREPISNT